MHTYTATITFQCAEDLDAMEMILGQNLLYLCAYLNDEEAHESEVCHIREELQIDPNQGVLS